MHAEYFFVLLIGTATQITGFLVNDGLIRIHAPAGEIVGVTQMAYVNGVQRQVQKFTGIPYAEAPMGHLRFRKPVPKPRFSTSFAATKQGPACYQSGNLIVISKETYSEDCLILNIVTPDPAHNAHYPVMIWIHGGGFIHGSSNEYDASGLSAFGDVIVVTVNYRLSGYGFFSTGDHTAPGNYGLWDQQLAIQWVNNNIAAFGGDTSNITIFGESAGSASVVYQSFYPGNRGLFQRVIGQSGSITGGWSYSDIGVIAAYSRKLAEYAGCNRAMAADYIECLRLESSEILNETLAYAAHNGVRNWTPVLDHEFLLDDPEKILDGSTTSTEALEMFHSVDLLIGANSAEGLLYTAETMAALNIPDISNYHVSRDSYENKEIPRLLQKYYHSDKYNRSITKAAIIFEYTTWEDADNEQKRMRNLYNIQSEYVMYVPTAMTADRHSNSSKATYVYLFATQPTYHLIPVPAILDGPGVMNHGDDLPFVFGYERMLNHMGVSYVRNGSMRKVTDMVMTMWTNFAKTGNPNQPTDIQPYTNTAWPEYDATSERFLVISPSMTTTSVRQCYAPRAVEFWVNLLPSLV